MRPFGGKVLVVGGDFRQLLPVLPRASEAEILANMPLQHYTMRDGTFKKYSLTDNIRLRLSGDDDPTHREWLLRLGAGELPYESELHAFAVQLPTHLCMEETATCEDFIHCIFPDVLHRAQACLQRGDVSEHDRWFRDRAILTSRNDVANELNLALLSRLDATAEVTSRSVDTVADADGDDAVNFPSEFLNTLVPSGLPPHELTLRTGALVILLRNLDKPKGLFNSVRAHSRNSNCGLNPRIPHVRNQNNSARKVRLDPPPVSQYADRNSGNCVGRITPVGFGTSRFGARGRDDVGWSTSGCTVQNLCGNASATGRVDDMGNIFKESSKRPSRAPRVISRAPFITARFSNIYFTKSLKSFHRIQATEHRTQ
jgi:hypothetical protein